MTARTRADDANGWGVLLEFKDPDGNAKTWAMPSALLSGEGAEWAGRLRDMGLQMAPGTAARNLVAQYIDTRKPTDRVTCTDRVGWHAGVYVLPSGCIGDGASGRRYVFQSDAGMEDTFRRAGDLATWQREVAARAAGNSRLVFGLACAFAGPMLRPAGMESGGFHLRGTSSLGKTTAQVLKKLTEIDWKPMTLVVSNSVSQPVLLAAGLDNAKGIITASGTKRSGDPANQNDPGVVAYKTFMQKYLPNEDPINEIGFSAYSWAVVLEQLLKDCGDELTPENIVAKATNMKDVRGPSLMPGITYNTTPTDYSPVKKMTIQSFDGAKWRPIKEVSVK